MRSGVVCVLLSFPLAACGRVPAPVEPVAPPAAITVSVAKIEVPPGDWPWWRGPERNGDAGAQSIPETWSETEHVLWKSPVPGRGHSSPICCAGKVFLTTADEGEQTQSLLAYDEQNGKLQWDKTIHQGGFVKVHPKNSQASATPACDGEHVFAVFANNDQLIVTACDLNGQQVWQTPVGPFHSEHGYGSSPVLFGSLVIVSGDSLGTGYLAALDRQTGKMVWRTPREASNENGNYATPLIADLAGRPQLIHPGFDRVTSYDPTNGRQIWYVDGPTRVIANTVAAQDPYVIVSGGYPDQETLCIRADGTGNVTDSHIVWRADRNVAYVPSPLAHDGRVLLLTGEGILADFDLESGDMLWQKRVGGNFSASVTRAGDVYLVPNEKGEVTVFRLTPEFEKVATNTLADGGGMATPTICDGRIFLRTDHSLYCIGETP